MGGMVVGAMVPLSLAAVNGRLGNGPTAQEVYEATRHFRVLTVNGWYGPGGKGPHFH